MYTFYVHSVLYPQLAAWLSGKNVGL